MHFTGIDQETKPVRPAPKSGSCKVKVLPRGKFSRTGEIKRKQWDSTPYIGHSGFNRRTVCKNLQLPVPTPDYTCVPVKRTKRLSNGEIEEREVLVCQENWKPAVWACGPQNMVHVMQCHKWGAGISRTDLTPLPNNYRILFCLGSDQTKTEDVYAHPVVCEISNGAASQDRGRLFDEGSLAAGGNHDICCCWNRLPGCWRES
ncbi:unnamed protein product [Candidula unifasciata]|uniref:Uncharacterized protein n=1 Tax=Candidula unifasciata TaxID=100452 RepID=A0A8S3ZF78_9EUPU|nr:unnamed protein product [Candidula unifasciata]